MRQKFTWVTLLSAAIMVTALYATPVRPHRRSGFVGTTLAMGRFGEIDVFNHLIPPDFWKSRHNSDIWLSWQKTKGCQTCTCRATSGRPEEAPAGTHIPAIA